MRVCALAFYVSHNICFFSAAEQCQVDTRTFTRPKKRLLAGHNLQQGLIRVCREEEAAFGEPDPSGSDEENTVPNGPVSPLPERKNVSVRKKNAVLHVLNGYILYLLCLVFPIKLTIYRYVPPPFKN